MAFITDDPTQGSPAAAETGPLVQGAVSAAAPTYTSGQTDPLSLTPAGALRVDSSGTVQPVSGTVIATQSNGANLHVDVDNFPTVQPVSGTVTANQGTNPWTVAGTVTANAGTGTFAVSDTTTHTELTTINTTLGSPFQAGGSISNTSFIATQATGSNLHVDVDNFPTTQPVSGTVTALQGTSPWVVSGTVTTSPNVNVHDGSGNSITSTVGSLNVDVTNIVPVSQSGTWNINNVNGTVSLPTGASTSANQTNGTQQTQVVQGGNTATVTAAGALKVDGSAVTQPISGTVTANAGTGNFTVVQSSGANLHVDVDNFPATQPVSGTVTALQGTSPWTISGTVTSNIGTTGGLALDTTVSGLQVSQGSTTSGEKGPLVQGAVTTSAPSYSNGQTDPLSLTTAGALRTDSSATTQPVSGTVAATQSGTWNINNISGTVSLPTGAATSANQTNGTQQTQIVQGGNTATVTAASALKVDGSAVTQPVSGTVTANAGTGNFTVVQATGTNLHTVVDSGTVTANQGTSPWVSNISQFGGSNVVTGTGASGAGIPRVTVANDSNILATQSGTWTVNAVPVDGTKQTYSAAIGSLAAAPAPTDVFTITGSATKTVRILHIEFSNTQNVATDNTVILIKRSTANSGGTSTTPTAVPHDSTNAAATAVVKAYTANPTLGTAVGTVRSNKVFGATAATSATTLIQEFGTRPSQAIVLRGTNEVLAINLNGQAFVGSSIDISIEWTEE